MEEAVFINDQIGQPRYIGSSETARKFKEGYEKLQIKFKQEEIEKIKKLPPLKQTKYYIDGKEVKQLDLNDLDFSHIGGMLTKEKILKALLTCFVLVTITSSLVLISFKAIKTEDEELKGKIFINA